MRQPWNILAALWLAAVLPAQVATTGDRADEECSVGVACGAATSDGRPLLWKNRDTQARDNVILAFDDGRFPYLGLCSPGASRTVWGGANGAGFCIMNSVSRDLPTGSDEGPGNGGFMKLALMRCATVDEFEALLEETNASGRRTVANFGVIDAVGGAAIFETSHRTFVRFDATAAEDGIIWRTNFATTAGGDRGSERFARAGTLCRDLPADGVFDHADLLRSFCRDLAPPPSAVAADGLRDVRETIHRQTTVAALVFHGVAPDEDPRFTTMWTVLGQPLFSVAVPCWPAAGVVEDLSGSPRSPICDAAKALQDQFYVAPAPGDVPADAELPGNIRWLRTEGLDQVRARLKAAEDQILAATAHRLETWRTGAKPPLPRFMRAFHEEQATRARAAVEALAAKAAGAVIR
jgi:hypothetical protein